jgi:hypothetical protein
MESDKLGKYHRQELTSVADPDKVKKPDPYQSEKPVAVDARYNKDVKAYKAGWRIIVEPWMITMEPWRLAAKPWRLCWPTLRICITFMKIWIALKKIGSGSASKEKSRSQIIIEGK